MTSVMTAPEILHGNSWNGHGSQSRGFRLSNENPVSYQVDSQHFELNKRVREAEEQSYRARQATSRH